MKHKTVVQSFWFCISDILWLFYLHHHSRKSRGNQVYYMKWILDSYTLTNMTLIREYLVHEGPLHLHVLPWQPNFNSILSTWLFLTPHMAVASTEVLSINSILNMTGTKRAGPQLGRETERQEMENVNIRPRLSMRRYLLHSPHPIQCLLTHTECHWEPRPRDYGSDYHTIGGGFYGNAT